MAGSIEQRGKTSWRLTVSGGFDSANKRIKYRKTVEAKDEEAAKKLLEKFEEEIEKGQYFQYAKQKFSEFIDKWMKEHAEKNLAPKTYASYKYHIDERIKPALGHLKLEQLRPLHLVEYYNNLSEDGMRKDGQEGKLTRTIQYNHRIISSILQDAVYWQIIPDNPAARVETPKHKAAETNFYNDDQARVFLELFLAEAPVKYKTGICIALTGGLRLGEVLGLEWDDIDEEKCIVNIKRASQDVPNKGMITKDPKTASSTREVKIPKFVMELIKKLRLEQNERIMKLGGNVEDGGKWIKTNRLFTQWNGKSMHYGTLTHYLTDFLADNGLPHISFHGLRHTAATILINQNLNLKAVQSILGHDQASTTANIYAHAIKKVNNQSADIMEDVFSKVISPAKESEKIISK